MLQPIPGSLVTQHLINTNEDSLGGSQEPMQPTVLTNAGSESNMSTRLDQAIEAMVNAAQQMSIMTSALAQQEAARAAREAAEKDRHAEERKNIQLAAKQISEVAAAIARIEAERERERTRRSNVQLELQLAAGVPVDPKFNWMFGDGVAPKVGAKATRSQTRFEKEKTNVKLSAFWFIYEATDQELTPVFIQFHDTPRVSIDGLSIKRLLLNEEDASEGMAVALVRILRKDEATRDPGSRGGCYYVTHKWAGRVLEGGSMDECEVIFKQPKAPYTFAGCTKVVVFMLLTVGWASLSIDFTKGATHLIHPTLSSTQPEVVLAEHFKLMEILTGAATAHMRSLGRISLPQKKWDYDVALKKGQPMKPNDSAIATAFYSIPKDEQFLVVSHDTIMLAKHTFLYKLQRFCFPTTKQHIRRGNPRRMTKTKKRDNNGRYISDVGNYFDMEMSLPEFSAGGSQTDSHTPNAG